MLRRTLSEPGLLKKLTSTHGSPLHVVFPQQAFQDARRWQHVLKTAYDKIDIRFGMKACKSNL
jgi:diaminopimelate decarboxylase